MKWFQMLKLMKVELGQMHFSNLETTFSVLTTLQIYNAVLRPVSLYTSQKMGQDWVTKSVGGGFID